MIYRQSVDCFIHLIFSFLMQKFAQGGFRQLSGSRFSMVGLSGSSRETRASQCLRFVLPMWSLQTLAAIRDSQVLKDDFPLNFGSPLEALRNVSCVKSRVISASLIIFQIRPHT